MDFILHLNPSAFYGLLLLTILSVWGVAAFGVACYMYFAKSRKRTSKARRRSSYNF